MSGFFIIQVIDFTQTRCWQDLLTWYQNQAPYPWSELTDPYPIWVSETMLQQTTTATVKNRFDTWFSVFPTVQDLAKADESQVLKAWEGLGYYRRAVHLHRAAQAIAQNGWPLSPEDWQKLPGVGPYAARAISSFSFNYPVVAFDTNVRRILCRLESRPTWDKPAETRWEENFRRLFNLGLSSNKVNAALMRLGQDVCTPKTPKCDSCPLVKVCKAYQQQTQDLIPHRPTKPQLVHETLYPMFLLRKEPPALLLEKSQASRFNGQYLPRFGSEGWWLRYEKHHYLGKFRHAVTHHRFQLECWAAFDEGYSATTWVNFQEIEDHPMPSVYRKIVNGPLLTFYRQGCFQS